MPPFIRPPGGPISRIIMPLVLLIAVLIIICTSLKDMMVWIDATLRRIGTTSITVLGVFIIGTVLHIALQTTPPVSSAEADIWDWIDKSGLRQYNKVFGEQGVQTRKDLLSNELENWIPEFSTLPPDKQYELRYAFSALKEEYYLQILLQKNNIPSTIVDRLKFRGVVSLVALSHLSDNVIQVVTEADSTLTDFKNLKHCVRHATDYIDHREELDLYSQVGKDFDSPLTPLAMKALKIDCLMA